MTSQHDSELDPPTENIFHFLSKIVIVIPIVVVVLAFFMKMNGKLEQQTNVRRNPALYASPFVTQKPAQLAAPKNSSSSAQFNLKGPLVCNYIDKEASLSASIKNKNIYVKMSDSKLTQHILVKGDCLYKWEIGKKTGEKVCKIGKFLDMFDSLSSLGLVDLDAMFGELSKAKPSTTITPPSMKKMTESCKKIEVKDEIFTLPTTITFKDTPLETIKK